VKFSRAQVSEKMNPEDRNRAVHALKWEWFNMNGYYPHSGQRDFHISDSRFRFVNAGTRGGKSRAAGEEAVVYLLVGPTRVWLVGQTYAMCEKEFRYIYDRMTSPLMMETFGSDCITKATFDDKGGNMMIRTKWGSEVKCISLDKADTSAFGDEVDLLIMCEPAQIKNPKRVYEQILFGRLTSRLGDMVGNGTPSGKAPAHDPDGWFYNICMKGLEGLVEHDTVGNEISYYTRSFPSWENPDFKDDPYWIRSWMNPKIFAEQYEGQFMTFSGAIFESFTSSVHVIKPFKIPKHWNRYESIDPGYSGEFCWLAGVTGYDNSLYICDEYFTNKTLYIEHANEIWMRRMRDYGLPFTAIREQYKNSNFDLYKKVSSKNLAPRITQLAIDPEDPQCQAEFASWGLPNYKANNDVHIGIDRVENRLKGSYPKLFITSNNTHLIEALENHAWGEKYRSDGVVDVRKPSNDKYKHACDCLRYICMSSLSSSIDLQPEINQYDPPLWDILMETSGRSGKYPHDLNQAERRMGNGF
jgi:hypothetical protein